MELFRSIISICFDAFKTPFTLFGIWDFSFFDVVIYSVVGFLLFDLVGVFFNVD